MTPNARPARRVGCVSNLPSRHRRDTIHAQADAAKKAKAHASKKGKKVLSGVPVIPSAGAPRIAWFRPPARRDSRDSFHRRAATRDPAQAVSKRAPKKKKTYDSDEESDNYDDDSEVRPGVQSRASENGARRSPTQDDWGAKQKKKAPAPKKAA